MAPSIKLNFFRWALTPQCPEIILETVVISFLSVLHSSNHGLRENLGKMECKNLPGGGIPFRTPRLLLSVDPIRPIDILNAQY
jgi:hypothetical protein